MDRTGSLALVVFSMVLVGCGPSDEIVQGRVDSAIQANEWTWLEATVAKRQLTLTGLAPDEAVVTDAPALLAQVMGVKSVVNNVQLAN